MNFKRFLSFKGIAIFALLSLLTILFLNYYKTQTFSLSSSTKTGMDTVTLSTTTVTQNGTINYVINVDNTGTIIEYPVLKDILATGTTLVKGSLKTSNGWTAKFSTNAGTSFVTNEPAANVNALEIKGVTIPQILQVFLQMLVLQKFKYQFRSEVLQLEEKDKMDLYP